MYIFAFLNTDMVVYTPNCHVDFNHTVVIVQPCNVRWGPGCPGIDILPEILTVSEPKKCMSQRGTTFDKYMLSGMPLTISCVYVHVYVYVYIYKYIYMCVYIYIFIWYIWICIYFSLYIGVWKTASEILIHQMLYRPCYVVVACFKSH